MSLRIARLLLLNLGLLGMLVLPASAQLEWRVSVKFILSASGNRPASGSINTDAEVEAQIDLANEILNGHGRGYTLRLTEIVDLAGVSQHYSVAVDDGRDALDTAAKANPALYAYRTNAINIYINGSSSSGIGSFPSSSTDITFVGQGLRTTTFLHEIGHFMDLCHTQGCPCGSCDSGETGVCNTIPGDDNISDTLPDLECWDQNDIAQWTYGANYSGLSTSQKNRVDDVFNNMMSYHSTRNIFTPDQLDIATDTSNSARSNVATGRTRFVDRNAGIFQFGTSGLPYKTIAQGVDAANAGDIVLVRAGSYTDTPLINKRVFLRATRGNAVIGATAGDIGLAIPAEPPRPNVPDTYDGRTGE